MRKTLTLLTALALSVSLLAGCGGRIEGITSRAMQANTKN